MLYASLQVKLSADTAQLQQRKSYMYKYQKVNGIRPTFSARFVVSRMRRISAYPDTAE